MRMVGPGGQCAFAKTGGGADTSVLPKSRAGGLQPDHLYPVPDGDPGRIRRNDVRVLSLHVRDGRLERGT